MQDGIEDDTYGGSPTKFTGVLSDHPVQGYIAGSQFLKNGPQTFAPGEFKPYGGNPWADDLAQLVGEMWISLRAGKPMMLEDIMQRLAKLMERP